MFDKVMIFILCCVLALCFVAMLVLPSCEELGGKKVFSHYQYIFNGKTTNLIPIYECEMESKQ